QLNPRHFNPRGFIGARPAFVAQARRGVAIRVHDFERRLPEVAIAGLRIKLLRALWTALAGRHADQGLVEPPIVTHLKIQTEGCGLEGERFPEKGGRGEEDRRAQECEAPAEAFQGASCRYHPRYPARARQGHCAAMSPPTPARRGPWSVVP